tara:strand:- start:7720 stop:8781 length:1062 start_codon:yes stop_codon:yes gene_type:complete
MLSRFERDQLQYLLHQTVALKGTQWPNPAVGAMVCIEGDIISEGYHISAGEDHAEVIALKRAGSASKGATLIVTLEPCVHVGKTPACVDAIINAGISRVIWAIDDPNPVVYGKAKAILEAKGISVLGHCLPEEGFACIKEFYTFHQRNRPFIYLKSAVSLDGKIAPDNTKLHYISSSKSLEKVQDLRRLVQGICVGVGTINTDLPQLSIRDSQAQPSIIVMDPKGQINRSWLNDICNSGRHVIHCTTGFFEFQHDLYTPYRKLGDDKSKNWENLWLYLATEHQMHAILVEAGSGVFRSMFTSELWDEFWVFRVPKFFNHGVSWGNGPLPDIPLSVKTIEVLSEDTLTIYTHAI